MNLCKMRWIACIIFQLSLCSWSLGFQQVILKPQEKILQDFKEFTEAELSYMTERLGFVDDVNIQHSGIDLDPDTDEVLFLNPAEKFLQTFLHLYHRGYEAHDTKITQRYFENPKKIMRLCPTYLLDPIFSQNQISSINKADAVPRYELKFVEFQYFTRKTELVKVVRCPVSVPLDGGSFEIGLYFLEINYKLVFDDSHRGYFVFINKVVPWNTNRRQPLQLLMYIDPDKYDESNKFPEMDTRGAEATLLDAVNSVSSRTLKLILKDKKPQKSNPNEIWTGTMMDKMSEDRRKYMHYFGEAAEIMLIAKSYGFIRYPGYHGRLWRLKKALLILDRMAEDFIIDREKMEEIKKMEPRKTCRNYISLSDQLVKRKIFPRDRGRPRYVTKFVNFTTSKYQGSRTARELLRCPIIFGEKKQPKNIYLLPIHYENTAKLPQLFTFFDDPQDSDSVNVYILSQVSELVNKVDYDFIDTNFENESEVPSTSGSRPSHTETSSTTTTNLDVASLSTGLGDTDTVSHPTGPEESDTAPTSTFDLGSDSFTSLPRYINIIPR